MHGVFLKNISIRQIIKIARAFYTNVVFLENKLFDKFKMGSWYTIEQKYTLKIT